MQQIYGSQLVSKYAVEIVTKRLASAPPSQRLLYMGLLTIIDYIRSRGEIPTSALIAERTGVTSSNVTRYVSTLVKAGILEKRRVPNRKGRSYAYELYFAQTEDLKALLSRAFGPLPLREESSDRSGGA